MCIAVAITDRAPDMGALEKMAEANPDGAGLAWVAAGRVHWMKGLTLKDVAAMLDVIPRPSLLHFRLASAGGKHPTLTHPFPIQTGADLALNGQASAVLIHNGHWSQWDIALHTMRQARVNVPKGRLSDTRLMAHLASLGHTNKWLKRVAGTGQRIAVLRSDRTTTLYGDWKEHDGYHVSNLYWQNGSIHIDPAWLADFQVRYAMSKSDKESGSRPTMNGSDYLPVRYRMAAIEAELDKEARATQATSCEPALDADMWIGE